MNKWELLNKIGELLDVLLPILQKLGKKETFLGLPLNYKELSYEQVREAYEWLTKINDGPLKRYKEIRKHGNDKYWDTLRVLWGSDFREVRLLMAAEKHLKDSIYGKRPKVLSCRGRNFKIEKTKSTHCG